MTELSLRDSEEQDQSIDFSIEDDWMMKITKTGVKFNREKWPDIAEDEFAERVLRFLEEMLPVKFAKNWQFMNWIPPYPTGWIKTSDELPTKTGHYLTYGVWWEDQYSMEPWVGVHYWCTERENWFEDSDRIRGPNAITHWMPLPDKPDE